MQLIGNIIKSNTKTNIFFIIYQSRFENRIGTLFMTTIYILCAIFNICKFLLYIYFF